jgi:hypothetical protein
VRWLGLSYSLPSGSSSSPRVAVWRRLRQLGAGWLTEKLLATVGAVASAKKRRAPARR